MKGQTIYKWKQRGLLLRDDETYDDIYNYVMSINNCQLCNDEFSHINKKLRCSNK